MKNWLKYAIGFAVCFAIRLVPFRPPNVEPVMTTTMPFSKKFGYIAGFIFGFMSIALFDAFTGKLGMWTWITAVAYGLVGLGAAWFFRKRKSSIKNYGIYAVIGTLAYDATTGLTTGPLLFKQPFMEALTGQIPFTIVHLAGNLVFSLTLSPLLYKWVVDNKSLELDKLLARFSSAIKT